MILLDTHSLVWWIDGTLATHSKRAEAAIRAETAPRSIAVSAISAWEVARLVDRDRLRLSIEVEAWFAQIEESGRVVFVPVDRAIAIESVRLPGEFHPDPADRMIVATARRLGVPLVTGDRAIRRYRHVRTVW